MELKIKINIYGNKNTALPVTHCCSNKHRSNTDKSKTNCNSCSNCKNSCGSCTSSSNADNNTDFIKTGQLYENLKKFLSASDVSRNIDINFIDLTKTDLLDEEGVKVSHVIHKGFNPPITVIDGIIRYYAGISNILVYKDVKELLE